MKSGLLATVMTLVAPLAPVWAGEWATSGSAAVELRWFVDDPQFAGQFSGAQASLMLNPEWDWDSTEGQHQISVSPFLRLDGRDDSRSHFDLRPIEILVYGRCKLFYCTISSCRLFKFGLQPGPFQNWNDAVRYRI